MKEQKGAYKFIDEEFIASLQNVDTRDDTAKLNDLRSSVRRLVGEWQLTSECELDLAAARAYRECREQLSALIDGKGESDG